MSDFCCVDVETTNRSRQSVCEIGLARVENGAITDRWGSLVNPQEKFKSMMTHIHGIDPTMVVDSPTIDRIWDRLIGFIGRDGYLCSHSAFDRGALRAVAEKHELDPLLVTWKDSLTMARSAWPEREGYGLRSLADDFGIGFKHHSALEDATVCPKSQ